VQRLHGDLLADSGLAEDENRRILARDLRDAMPQPAEARRIPDQSLAQRI